MAICSVMDCDRQVIAKGMCLKHYQQERKKNDKKVCKSLGCNSPVLARGLCSAHYQRLWKHGHTDILTMHGSSVISRIMDKVTIDGNGCWIFQGSLVAGYGRIGLNGTTKGAHVVTYEDKYGPVPEGLELDHFYCNNKQCCNPDHVEPVAHTENMRRHYSINRGDD